MVHGVSQTEESLLFSNLKFEPITGYGNMGFIFKICKMSRIADNKRSATNKFHEIKIRHLLWINYLIIISPKKKTVYMHMKSVTNNILPLNILSED